MKTPDFNPKTNIMARAIYEYLALLAGVVVVITLLAVCFMLTGLVGFAVFIGLVVVIFFGVMYVGERTSEARLAESRAKTNHSWYHGPNAAMRYSRTERSNDCTYCVEELAAEGVQAD